jgi:hypothetical protein
MHVEDGKLRSTTGITDSQGRKTMSWVYDALVEALEEMFADVPYPQYLADFKEMNDE